MQITAWIQKRLTGTSQDWSGFHYFSLFTKTYKVWQSFSHPSLFFPGSASLPTSISPLRQQRGWGIGVGVTPKCQKTCAISMGSLWAAASSRARALLWHGLSPDCRVEICSTMVPHGLREGSFLLAFSTGWKESSWQPTPPPPLSSSWYLQSCSSLLPLTLLS